MHTKEHFENDFNQKKEEIIYERKKRYMKEYTDKIADGMSESIIPYSWEEAISMLPKETLAYVYKNYASESTKLKENLIKLISYGRLRSTGKLMILPVDQGFEHGPERSFMQNPEAFDPSYHYKMALMFGFNAIVAPIGFLSLIKDSEQVVNEIKQEIYKSMPEVKDFGLYSPNLEACSLPKILKLNSNNYFDSYAGAEPYQSLNASVEDAVALGCIGVGFTIYPGSSRFQEMLQELSFVIREAKKAGLVVIVWAYPRGSNLQNSPIAKTKTESETALDVTTYAAHIACLMGAHVVKVKLPNPSFFYPDIEDNINKEYEKEHSENPLTRRGMVSMLKRACFNGRRMVIFSGGKYKDDDGIIHEIESIRDGGGDGSIIGRNCFQRKYKDAKQLIDRISGVYIGQE